MYKQLELQKQIAHAQEVLDYLKSQLNELDSEAQDAYHDTQRGLDEQVHWAQLTEDVKNKWRTLIFAMTLK